MPDNLPTMAELLRAEKHGDPPRLAFFPTQPEPYQATTLSISHA